MDYDLLSKTQLQEHLSLLEAKYKRLCALYVALDGANKCRSELIQLIKNNQSQQITVHCHISKRNLRKFKPTRPRRRN